MNRDEFADFYSASFTRVSAAVRAYCGDSDVAHEATQEGFARAFARWPRFEERARAYGWVTATAINLSKRHFRLRARRTAPEGATSLPGPASDRLDLLAALRSLPERQRQAVVPHYLMDCRVATVADLMGLSEGTVKAHLHRARSTLHDLLELRDELTDELKGALDKEYASGSPDLEWVLTRGHRLRVRRLALISLAAAMVAAVIATTIIVLPTDDRTPIFVAGDPSVRPRESISPQVPRERELVEEMTDQQRAEVFAFRALADTGLMDPFGKRSYNWTYEDDTTQTPSGLWRIGFAASECTSFGCRGLSGEDPDSGNPLADTFVVVELNGGAWHIIDIEGNVLTEERERVVGYQLPDRVEPSHWEVPAASTRQTPDEGISVTMLPLWVGPYPTIAPGSVCTIDLRDGEGRVVADRVVFYQEAPRREFERAGWGYDRGIQGPDRAEGVQVECRQYTGPGWEVRSGPEILGGPNMVSGITAELVWRGEEGFTAAAFCRATLVDHAGEVVWEGSSKVLPLWRPNELRDYPYRTDVHITAGGGPVDAQRIGEFSCRSL